MRPKLRDRRLYWRGNVLWARVPTPNGKRRVATRCTSEVAATAFADEAERKYADPSYAAAAAETVSGIADALIANMKRRERAEATLEKASTKLGHFVRLWENGGALPLPLTRVTASLVTEYIDARRKEGASNHTIGMEVDHLGMALKLARHLGTFHLEVARVMPPFFTKGHKPKERAPTRGEVDALLAQFPLMRRAHLAYFVATGARLGEAERAQRGDTNWTTRMVLLRGTKTKAAWKEVPITALVEDLLTYALEHAPGAELLFAPWGKLHRDVAAACVRAEIPKCTPNDLRRAFGKWHAQAGVSIQLVSKLLRHTTDKLAQTTYANLGAHDVGAVVAKQLTTHAAGVPAVYTEAAETTESSANAQPSDDAKPREKAKNGAPAGVVETPTNALGKLGQSLGPNTHVAARSVGNRLAWDRRRQSQNVPDLYTGNSQKTPRNARPAWLLEATANLAMALLEKQGAVSC
jgi:integrase